MDIRKFLSCLLTVLLLLEPVLSVRASETTLPAETEEAVMETPETTVPAETLPPATEETLPPETIPATTAEILPPETTAATLPAETTQPTIPETTEPTVPETEPAETLPEMLPPESIAPSAPEPLYATIAEAWAMPVGTENITIRGVVVYAQGTQAVLQDDTGGIRLSFSAPPELYLGDTLVVTGSRSGGFQVTDHRYEGISTLPARDFRLLDAPENLRVKITGATLGNGSLQQDEFSMTLIATIPDTLGAGSLVDAWGVILDGRFYADSLEPGTAPAKPEVEADGGWNLYFGLLHAHTDLSDGLGTVEEAFQYAAQVEGLDFFAVTDHSNSFDNAENGAIASEGTAISAAWTRGKAAAAAVTTGDFVGIFGYEMTWTEDMVLGHMNTFATSGWQTRNQPGMDDLEGYYEILTTAPDSISQFNHPSHSYGNFDYFSHYDPAYDQVIHLMEVGWEGGNTAYDLYPQALDQGWHVAPTIGQNNHKGSWGDADTGRTVLLSKNLTEDSLYDAMRNHRVYATEDADLEILYTLNGQIMGSILGPTRNLCAEVTLKDPTDDAIGEVAVLADGGEVISRQWSQGSAETLYFQLPAGYSYYYLQITQPDGDVAITAPVWVDQYENMGISAFTAEEDCPVEGESASLTLTVFNQEGVEFAMERIEFCANGTLVEKILDPGPLLSMQTYTHLLTLPCPQPGEITVTATVTGTVAGDRRTYSAELVLHCQSKDVTPQLPIAQVRTGTRGETYRVEGYVTAGNDNPYNTFPDTIYLQDDTGGIAVAGHFAREIRVGDPLVVTGVLREQRGNLVLELVDWTKTEAQTYRHVPQTISNTLAKNYSLRGGQLLQVEGTVASFTTTVNEEGISRFTLQDDRGVLATVVIEEGIRSGAHGTNTLASVVKKGKTVRAMGILHMDEYGNPVLRVRNCDEVVSVAARRTPTPKADKTNPGTADPLAPLWRLLDFLGL